jgi:osmotically inducible protein OsmC
VSTEATVHLEPVDGKQTIVRIELATEGVVEGIDATAFEAVAEDAKVNCPVSRLLTGAEIVVRASLVG